MPPKPTLAQERDAYAQSLAFHRSAVTFDWDGRHLMGNVRGWYRQESTGGTLRLIVHHFNGERWPIDPGLASVNVLEVDWPEPDEQP